jgi:hypothetical protein
MQYKKVPKKNRKKFLVSFLVLVLSSGLVLFILEKNGNINLYSRNPDNSFQTTKPTNTINYNPPTKQEKEAGDEQKTNIVEKDAIDKTTKPDTAEVVIVDAAQYDDDIEVRAFVSNVIESGICRYIFRNGNNILEKSQSAFPDASSTPCTTLTISRTEFPTSGVWSLTVTYESASLQGSKSQEITIK